MLRLVALGLVCVVARHAMAAPDQAMPQGAAIAATCAACHRLDGGANGIPPIVGVGAERVIAMMQTFKADASSNHLMHAVSLTLSDEEIAAAAHYLATLGKEAKAP